MVVVVCHSPRPIIKLGQFQVGHKLALQFTLLFDAQDSVLASVVLVGQLT